MISKSAVFSLAAILVIQITNIKAQVSEEIPISSAELKRTVITPHLEAPIESGRNVLYCATFQLAWNKFREFSDMHLSDEPEVVRLLDKKLATEEDTSDDCYIALAGTLSDVLPRINKELESKFGEEAWHVEESDFSDQALFIYTFLFKRLLFDEEFEILEQSIRFRSNETIKKEDLENFEKLFQHRLSQTPMEVKGFGIKGDEQEKREQRLRKQITILDYRDYRETGIYRYTEFIIRLSSDSPNDEIILAKLIPKNTLLETIEEVERRIQEGQPDRMRDNEPLRIPYVNLDIEHEYQEIQGYLSVMAEGPAKAYQRIHFRLSERGAILKSEARIVMEGVTQAPLRYFVFDEPFLIYLKQKGSEYPYFALWVDNAELLVKETK